MHAIPAWRAQILLHPQAFAYMGPATFHQVPSHIVSLTNSQSSFKTHDDITSPVKSFLPALPFLVFTHVTSGTLLIQYYQNLFIFIYVCLSFP